MSSAESEGMKDNAEAGSVAGERLRKAREDLNLSVQDIAEKIRIDRCKVEALESGNVDAIGAPVFAAGYIRAYARIVALPADELIAEFESIGQISSISAQPISENNTADFGRMNNELPVTFSVGGHSGKRKSFGRWVSIGVLLLIVAAVVVWVVKSGWLTNTGTTADDTALINLPNKSSTETESNGQAMLEIPGQDVYVPVPQTTMDSDNFSVSSNHDAQIDTPAIELKETPVSPMADSPDELILQFQDDSWVEVNDAQGDRLIHQLAHAGQVHTLHGVAPFSVVLGYVPGVSILLNGESVDLNQYQGKRLVHLSVGSKHQ